MLPWHWFGAVIICLSIQGGGTTYVTIENDTWLIPVSSQSEDGYRSQVLHMWSESDEPILITLGNDRERHEYHVVLLLSNSTLNVAEVNPVENKIGIYSRPFNWTKTSWTSTLWWILTDDNEFYVGTGNDMNKTNALVQPELSERLNLSLVQVQGQGGDILVTLNQSNPCPEDFEKMPGSMTCYHYSDGDANHAEAKKKCEGMNGNLVSPRNERESSMIFRHPQAVGSYWAACADGHKCNIRRPGSSDTGEPIGTLCEIRIDAQVVPSTEAAAPARSVIVREENEMKMSVSEKTWEDAREACREDGEELVEIHDYKKQQELGELIEGQQVNAGTNNFWTGGKKRHPADDRGMWVTSGLPMKYSNMASASTTGGDCLAVSGFHPNRWIWLPCGDSLPYLCEHVFFQSTHRASTFTTNESMTSHIFQDIEYISMSRGRSGSASTTTPPTGSPGKTTVSPRIFLFGVDEDTAEAPLGPAIGITGLVFMIMFVILVCAMDLMGIKKQIDLLKRNLGIRDMTVCIPKVSKVQKFKE